MSNVDDIFPKRRAAVDPRTGELLASHDVLHEAALDVRRGARGSERR